jgi:hypothetical protein
MHIEPFGWPSTSRNANFSASAESGVDESLALDSGSESLGFLFDAQCHMVMAFLAKHSGRPRIPGNRNVVWALMPEPGLLPDTRKLPGLRSSDIPQNDARIPPPK